MVDDTPGEIGLVVIEDDTDLHPLVGLVCQGVNCQAISPRRWTAVNLNMDSTSWVEINETVGMLECPPNHAASNLRCLTEACEYIQLQCGAVTGGTLKHSGIPITTDWVPSALHSDGQASCPEYHVVVAVQCANNHCGLKQFTCQPLVPSCSFCVTWCNATQRTCGDDGCGGSCGTCSSDAYSLCYEDVGACVATKVEHETHWATSSASLGGIIDTNWEQMDWEGVIATGMRCQGPYCRTLRLIFMGLHVDGSQIDVSLWISDDTGSGLFMESGGEALSAECPTGKAVSRVQCDGSYCNNLRLECAKPFFWVVDKSGLPYVSPEWFSTEDYGYDNCPDGYVMTGLECKESDGPLCLSDCDSYCNKKKLHCRPIMPETFGGSNLGVVSEQQITAKGLIKYIDNPDEDVGVIDRAFQLFPLIAVRLVSLFVVLMV